MKENIMSEEAFNELINGFEVVEKLTMYGRKNIKYHVQKLQQENKELENINEKLSSALESAENRIDKAIDLLNNPWSFESGNKEVDDITHNKKKEVINILKGGKNEY